MLLSISTASFYFMPFEAALDVIAQAGFEAVELAGYCQSGPYETAQHLKGADPRWAVKQVEARGLRIATLVCAPCTSATTRPGASTSFPATVGSIFPRSSLRSGDSPSTRRP